MREIAVIVVIAALAGIGAFLKSRTVRAATDKPPEQEQAQEGQEDDASR
jgi:hypothetical protein